MGGDAVAGKPTRGGDPKKHRKRCAEIREGVGAVGPEGVRVGDGGEWGGGASEAGGVAEIGHVGTLLPTPSHVERGKKEVE